MFNIGIFCTKQSLGRIMEIDPQMRRLCNVTYLPYSSAEHLVYLYTQNAEQFDAFLFGGSYPYNILSHRFDMQGKVCAYFNVSAADYYALFARLAVQEPGIDFSRVYLDRPEIPVDFESIFPPEKMPQQGSADIDWSTIDPCDWYEPLRRYYLALWNSGRVDRIVNRFGSMEDFFRENHICYSFLSPSPQSMMEVFNGVLARLNAVTANDSAACMGVVDSPVPLTEEQYTELGMQLENCNKHLGMVFLIYSHGGHFELTASMSVLKELTQQYTTCAVTEYLREALDFPVGVGWGCAASLVECHRNAHRALKEAMNGKQTAAFIITEEDVVIGPLSSRRCIRYTDDPAAEVTRLGSRLGVAPLYLSKILSVIRQRGSDVFSASEMAYYLNITTRSANRILNRLEECGLASVQYNRQKSLRGRPAKMYKVYLQKQL